MSRGGKRSDLHDVVVVGAGAAGVGVGLTLRHAGVDDLLILDREHVGASFEAWPDETRFITPSFATNSVGMLDLNSIAIGTSPAHSLRSEHPTGKEYAAYLRAVVNHFELPVYRGTHVLGIDKPDDSFDVRIPEGTIRARHVVWAAGEFQYPNRDRFPGAEHCVHTASVASYEQVEGDDIVVIGGYESGIDAAYHLARRGKRVRLLDRGSPWRSASSDPSVALSTFSLERMATIDFAERVELHPDTTALAVRCHGEAHAPTYTVAATDGVRFETSSPPLLAGGFDGSHQLVEDLFEKRDDGFPLLSDDDESTTTPGLFLCGPAVRHGGQAFCFIYKYRQRFAVVAKRIATSLDLPAEQLERYRLWGMYLDDLSCCGEECVC